MGNVEISAAGYSAILTDVGAALLGLKYQSRQLVPTTRQLDLLKTYFGSVIAPWPNRIADGSYSFDGIDYQLEINEVQRNNALHGYSAELTWRIANQSESVVEFQIEVGGSSGYPANIDLRVRYSLSEAGLEMNFRATNNSEFATPFGFAFHPYLSVSGDAANWLLKMDAKKYLEVDPARLLPLAMKPTAGTDFDFRSGRTPVSAFLDHAFTDFSKDAGRSSLQLIGADYGIEVSWDQDWLQVHYPKLNGEVSMVVIEPMSCPPNSFQSGLGLDVLAPHQIMHSRVQLGHLA